jgi:hypothetical protein
MNPTIMIVLLLAVGFGCSSQQLPNPAGEQKTTDETKQRNEKPMTMPLLDKESLVSAIENNGVVLLIRGSTASITQPDTRSESVDITAQVLEAIHGKAEKIVLLRRYTRKGDVVITPGKLYLVAAIPNSRFGTVLQLLDHLVCDDKKISASVEAHRAEIKKLQSQ